MRKGIMALENFDEEVVIDPATVVPAEGEVVAEPAADVTDFIEAPEAELIEMNDAATEVETIDEGIVEASETCEVLEVMQDSLAEAAEDGGMSEPEAEAVRVAVEHMCSRIGYPRSVKVFPAMEGFANKQTRIQATKVAMESIGEKVKQIWEAIVAHFKKAVEWLAKFYEHLTNASVGIAKRAEGLGKVAAGKAGKAAPADAKATGGFAKYLAVGGKVPENDKFVSAFETYLKSVVALQQVQSHVCIEGQKAVIDMMSAVADEAAFGGKVTDVVKVFASNTVGSISSDKDLASEGMEVREEKLGFGDKSFFFTVVADEAKSGELAGKVKFQIGTSSGAKDAEVKEGGFEPLGVDAVENVAKAVKAHMVTYVDLKKEIKAVQEAQKAIEGAMGKLVKEADKTEGSKAGANGKVAAGIARAYISAMTSGASALSKYDMGTCKAALDYCAASLKLLPGASKEAAAA